MSHFAVCLSCLLDRSITSCARIIISFSRMFTWFNDFYPIIHNASHFYDKSVLLFLSHNLQKQYVQFIPEAVFTILQSPVFKFFCLSFCFWFYLMWYLIYFSWCTNLNGLQFLLIFFICLDPLINLLMV